MTLLNIFNGLRLVSFALVFASFVAMVAVGQFHGGGALGGKVTDGHYYLAKKRALIEVAESVYRQVQLVELSFLVMFALAFVVSLAYVNLKMSREEYVPDQDWDKGA